MTYLKGGYSIIDLTQYTFTDNATTLKDEDAKKILNAFNGKPLMLKYLKGGSYVCCQFVCVQTDDITQSIYIPVLFYDNKSVEGYYELNVETKELSWNALS